jgi:polygalacturonase
MPLHASSPRGLIRRRLATRRWPVPANRIPHPHRPGHRPAGPTRFLLLGLALLAQLQVAVAGTPVASLEWGDVPAILARIRAPEFPARDFNVLDYGAAGDGEADSLPAVRRAITACADAGGGRVVVPAGNYLLNGPIHLRSNVNLHLAEGATLLFSGQPEHFLPAVLTRWEGVILYNYSPMIYARGAENIAITGRGVIDANARREFHGWAMGISKLQYPAQERSRQMGASGTPIEDRRFGAGSFLRPSTIQPYECRNVLIEGVTIKDAPFWVIHPTFCTNVTVRGVTVDSHLINNDGCDPDSCTDVLIEDCVFKTGDDGVALKAGRDADAWRDGRRTENVVIRNCVFQSKINALCIGSEMSAGVRHVFMEDCRVEEGESCIYFKSNADRGGAIENVRVRRVRIGQSRAGVVRFETNYHSYRGGRAPTAYRDFVIEDVTCADAVNYAVFAEGTAESPIEQVILRNVSVERAREPLFLRNTTSLRLVNVRVNGLLLPADPPETPPDTARLPIRL